MYNEIFRRITNYVRSLMPNGTNWSYDDYRVVSDDLGGGMRFQIQFDSSDPTLQEKLMNIIENRFYGAKCIKGFGRDWGYYISVNVGEKEVKQISAYLESEKPVKMPSIEEITETDLVIWDSNEKNNENSLDCMSR